MQQPHLSVEQRQLALQLRARGWTLREIGPQVDCAFATVGRIAERVRQDWLLPYVHQRYDDVALLAAPRPEPTRV